MAERPTSTKITKRVYADFFTQFLANPVSGQLATVVNEASVKQAVKNIVLTNQGERLYKADLGGDIYKLLFENATPTTLTLAQVKIINALQRYEPRINIISVSINEEDQSAIDNNLVIINIVYRVINTEQNQNVTVAVERLR